MMNRIGAIDGWRAIAAFGVLWTHTWAITKFQTFRVANIDLFKAINIVGNGVHLFFIISGFCMYLVFKKNPITNAKSYFNFIIKRWIRIAPAFYFAAIVIGFDNLLSKNEALFPRLFFNLFFIHNYSIGSIISASFWSLAVEWHFYILLPLLFVIFKYLKVVYGSFLIIVIGIVLNIAHYKHILLPQTGWSYVLPANIIHFIWGILLGYFLSSSVRLPDWSANIFAIIPALLISFLGKTLFSQNAIDLSGNYDWIVLSIGPPIMTFGFCWLIYISLTNTVIGKIVGNKVLTWFGRISYSFYLWHLFILQLIFKFIEGSLQYSSLNPFILFISTVIILIPVSYISYLIFERFYFLNRR